MATSTLTPRRTGARHTTVAYKVLMAGTGLIMIGFLVGHMAGNLKAFDSGESFNEYAHHLRVLGEPILPKGAFLWVFRIVLLGSIIGHVYAALMLSRRAGQARQGGYRDKANYQRSYASRTMRWGGVIILLFVIFHILHLTTSSVQPDGAYHAEPYARMVAGFQIPWVTVFYLAAVTMVSLHVMHGFWSACQTLGITGGSRGKAIKFIGYGITGILLAGFAAVPIAVMTGMIS